MQKKSEPAGLPAVSAWLRRYLYLTAAATGAAILIVEILGAKMLAPYFGTSHFVWTAQISVTLVSLAAGYYLGGWLADRRPQLGGLYLCLTGAALYLSLAVLLCRTLAYYFLEFNLALGALLTSTALFFVPLTLLATTGPFLVRLLTASVSVVGRQMGRLSAVSTLGSVAGTALIGYVLIPLLPNSVTMVLTAFLLLGLVAGYVVAWGGLFGGKPLLSSALIAGVLLGYGAIHRESQLRSEAYAEVYFANSNFGQLQVWQTLDGTRRYYLNDFLTQNTYDPAERRSVSLFTYMLAGLARVYTPRIERVLCIGLGMGIVPMEFARQGVAVNVVEINPAVIPVAVKYFDLDTHRLHIIVGDGRYYLNECRQRYDAIILDAFLGDSSPSHLLSREAFQAMRRVLAPGGALVINSFASFEPGRDFFGASLDKTLRSVFPSVLIHDGANGNVFFVASVQQSLEFHHNPDLSYVHPVCYQEVKETYPRVRRLHPGAGQVLTDDHNPIEFYDAANRERLRRNLALSMKD